MAMTADAPLNVTRLIDDGRVGRAQIIAVMLCAAVAFLDGVDSQSIALAAPIIAEGMKLTRAALGPVFSAGLLGAGIGALTFGPLGDLFGRKRILILATAIFGLFTFLTALVQSYDMLLLVRFAAGLGLGGATPCFITLASEYVPSPRRAMVVSLIWAAFPLGGMAGGFFNGYILGAFSWQTMFLIGGGAPIAAASVLGLWLPESIRFLMARGADPSRIAAILARIRPGTPAATHYVASEEPAGRAPLAQLFTGDRVAQTLLLWVLFVTGFGVLAITVNWTPVLLREHGFPPAAAGMALGFHGLGALIGMGSAGKLIERFGGIPVLCPALLLGAAMTGALGYAAVSLPAMSIVLALIGVLVGMGASGSIALASLIYPTAMRSTGTGWAMGMGRFGQMLTPLFAGAVTAAGYSGVELFLAFALAPLIGALAVLALRGSPAAAPQPS
jgi:MFS transporter, AAHS family, 4-hydroxybenzoate transporter